VELLSAISFVVYSRLSVLMKDEGRMRNPSTRIVDDNSWQFGNVRRASDLLIISKTVRQKTGTLDVIWILHFSLQFLFEIFFVPVNI
jgi:hypothetical protein